MNWKKERITPAIAAKYLATREEGYQRKFKEGLARNYGITMHNGHWGVTHQGIAFDEKGRLIDGQHRLAAIVESGTTQTFWVCRAVPEKQGDIFTLDQIDRGAVRTVGEQLQLRHGYKQGNAIAGTVNAIGQMMCRIGGAATGRMDVGRTLGILEIYKSDAIWIVDKFSSTRAVRLWRSSGIYAPLVIARHVAIPQTEDFCEQLASGENLKSGTPAHSLFKWRCGDGRNVARNILITATAFALRKHYEGEPLKRINRFTRYGVDFWLEMQPRNVQKVRSLFSME